MRTASDAVELVEEPDRLIIHYPKKVRQHTRVWLLFWLLIFIWMLFTELLLTADRSLTLFSEPRFPILLLTVFIYLALRPGTWLAHLGIPLPLTVEINPAGQLKAGILTWQFPGPLAASCAATPALNIRFLRRKRHWLILKHGALAPLWLPGGATQDENECLARQITAWAQRRMNGVPSDESVAPQRMTKWFVIPILLLLPLLVIWFVSVPAGMYWLMTIGSDYGGTGPYLNRQGPLGTWAMTAMAIFAVLALALARWRMARLARREVAAGATVRALRNVSTLVLIAAGCCVAGRIAQIFELRALTAPVVTLRQPVQVDTTTYINCATRLTITEPVLGRNVDYCDSKYPASYWQDAAGIEIQQAQNALGVRILSVHPTEAAPVTP